MCIHKMKTQTSALILHRRDGSVSFKLPGKKAYSITPGQTDNMPATVNAVRADFEAKGLKVEERKAN